MSGPLPLSPHPALPNHPASFPILPSSHFLALRLHFEARGKRSVRAKFRNALRMGLVVEVHPLRQSCLVSYSCKTAKSPYRIGVRTLEHEGLLPEVFYYRHLVFDWEETHCHKSASKIPAFPMAGHQQGKWQITTTHEPPQLEARRQHRSLIALEHHAVV